MRHRHQGCGPRGRFEINLPEGLMAMIVIRVLSLSWSYTYTQ